MSQAGVVPAGPGVAAMAVRAEIMQTNGVRHDRPTRHVDSSRLDGG